MPTSLIVLAVIVVVLVFMYNSLVSKKNQVENIFAGVDAVLKKRYDLIPNLVASVSKYMEHEKSAPISACMKARSVSPRPGTRCRWNPA